MLTSHIVPEQISAMDERIAVSAEVDLLQDVPALSNTGARSSEREK